MAADHQNTTDPLGVPCEEIIVYFAKWLVCGIQVHCKVSAEEQGVERDAPAEKWEQVWGFLWSIDETRAVKW